MGQSLFDRGYSGEMARVFGKNIASDKKVYIIADGERKYLYYHKTCGVMVADPDLHDKFCPAKPIEP